MIQVENLSFSYANHVEFALERLEIAHWRDRGYGSISGGERQLVGIIAVKHKDSAFLNQVRGHQHCRSFRLSLENREELFLQVLDFMRGKLNGKLA